MLVHLVAALLQLPAPAPAQLPAAPAAAAKPAAPADTSARERRRRRRESRAPKRQQVTAAHLATAFKDPAARSLLDLARSARQRQDSALQSYDATTYQRISAGLGIGRIGRDRLAFRSETATRVQWRRGVGAYVDVVGSRTVVPIAGRSGRAEVDGDISPIPYYPGSETLWIGSSVARQQVDENEGIVHPLAEGSEAYYTFETGDSVTFRLPDARAIRLRELKIRPREPKWNLAVGSLWFDMSGGQLVRAAYRMSVPMDIAAVAKEDDSTEFNDVPTLVKPLIFPMTAQVSAIGVEYGLFQGRFWLPRLQVAEGGATMGVMHVPFKLEQRYQYEHVNAGATLAPIPDTPTDSVRRGITIGTHIGSEDSLKTFGDSARAARRAARKTCDASGMHVYTRQSRGNPNPVLMRVSCDSTKLASSPELPPSIYDSSDELMGGEEMQALVAQALSMDAQASFSPQLPAVSLERPRYNRIEGLSLGGRVEQVLGAGYSARAVGRIGLADREPNLELSGSRSDLRRTLSVTAYNRLVSASDWGNPLAFGSSISAFLFGRDDGFYYRATGVEFASAPDEPSGSALSWSLFAEQERTARRKTTFSLSSALGRDGFGENVESTRGTYLGGRARLSGTRGLDPEALRLFSDLRLEAAHGDSGGYGRVATEMTASHGLGNGAAALTLGAGTSVGAIPPQRFWFLGGVNTVHGQTPGASVGNAFWIARGELARGLGVVRPVVFADIGWAGDRSRWKEVGVPVSGAGIGSSFLDGLLRVDLSRGINPGHQWRVDAYVSALF